MSYNAYVCKIKNLRKHPNADRLMLGECFGNTVCVDTSYEVDELGIYFPTDGQVSPEFAECNNLLRKKDENGKQKFTDVKVQGFTYHGAPEEAESTISGSGKGRLFPTLYYQEVTSKTPVSGHTSFVNTSEISKRNGRVYHYTFPDGTTKPRITFDIKTKKDGATEEKSDKVTFDFKNRTESFNPAQWYKINVTIKGAKIGNASNIIIDKF